MIAELSLPTLNMLTILFVVLASVLALLVIGAVVSLVLSYEISRYDEEAVTAAKVGRRKPLTIIAIVATVGMLFSVAVAGWAGTEYGVRHDTDVPQRVDRSEVKIDSNTPTGVIVNGR